MNWFLFWLCIHLISAVLAFGPTFTFPLIGALAQKMPGSLHFATELNEVIEKRLVLPFVFMMGVSGVGLIWSGNVDFLRSTYLLVAIGLYVVAVTFSLVVQVPTSRKLAHLAAEAPPGPPSGEIMALIARARAGGIFLSLMFFSIILLMIIKPGGVYYR